MIQNDTVIQIPIGMTDSFPDHPFLVRDDALMQQLINSIRTMGVLVPIIVTEKRTADT